MISGMIDFLDTAEKLRELRGLLKSLFEASSTREYWEIMEKLKEVSKC